MTALKSDHSLWKRSLNDFQKVMRQWATLAPYNAGHVMRVSGAPDLERWSRALANALRAAGLTTDLQFPIEASELGIDQKIVAELNAPFAAETLPLRAFVLADEPDSHLFGLFFDHWFADSPSIRSLMQHAFAHYGGEVENLPPLRFAGEDQSFGHGGLFSQAGALFFCVRNYFRHRRAHRIRLRDPLDFRAGFFSRRFPDGAVDRIRAAAKENGGTINDLFIAAASQVLAEFIAKYRKRREKPFRTRRDRIGVATAVDLRSLADGKLDNVFGFFLGYFTIVLDHPEKRSLPELTTTIARSTSRNKTKTRALQFLWSLRIAHWGWNIRPRPRSQAQIFNKRMPLLAGISNVNLNRSWPDQDRARPGHPAVLDYFRVSPVGPLLPLVFTLTTVRDRLSLNVTYRRTAFAGDEAQLIADDLIDRLCRAGKSHTL